MKIIIPDEQSDAIITQTLPVRPNMTARDVCEYLCVRVCACVYVTERH